MILGGGRRRGGGSDMLLVLVNFEVGSSSNDVHFNLWRPTAERDSRFYAQSEIGDVGEPTIDELSDEKANKVPN